MTTPALGEPYRSIRDSHVAAVMAERFGGDRERDLLRRMMRRHEVVRNGTSSNLEARQLDLLGERP